MKNYIFICIVSFFVLLGCNEVQEESIDTNQSTTTDTTQESTTQIQSSKEITVLDITTQIEETEELDSLSEVITSVDTTENNSSEEKNLKKDIPLDEAPSKEWYIRLLIEDLSNHLKTASTQLGQVDSSRAIESFNLKALAPFGSRYVDVVFKNPVGMEVGEYKSDFHIVSNTLDTWDFTVKSHDSNAMMVLGYRGLFVLNPYTDSEDRERYTETRMRTHPLLAQMVLVDVSENKEIPMQLNAKMNEYLFSMNGQKEKHFRWKLNPLSVEVKTLRSGFALRASAKEELNRLEIKALRMDAKFKTKKEKKGDFDALPPKFEVLVK
jgi:hypothetical protein